jgi:hypothetical protein
LLDRDLLDTVVDKVSVETGEEDEKDEEWPLISGIKSKLSSFTHIRVAFRKHHAQPFSEFALTNWFITFAIYVSILFSR